MRRNNPPNQPWNRRGREPGKHQTSYAIEPRLDGLSSLLRSFYAEGLTGFYWAHSSPVKNKQQKHLWKKSFQKRLWMIYLSLIKESVGADMEKPTRASAAPSCSTLNVKAVHVNNSKVIKPIKWHSALNKWWERSAAAGRHWSDGRLRGGELKLTFVQISDYSRTATFTVSLACSETRLKGFLMVPGFTVKLFCHFLSSFTPTFLRMDDLIKGCVWIPSPLARFSFEGVSFQGDWKRPSKHQRASTLSRLVNIEAVNMNTLTYTINQTELTR